MTGRQIGPYALLERLGAGGMGEVYRARDTRQARDVAIKVLLPVLAADADRLRRFENEARAASSLNHPNILTTYDVGTADGSPYLVSELLEGQTLRAKLGGRALPTARAIEYAHQIARGLEAAHEKGILHRDLKPENLFITKGERVKILDFGLAKLARPEAGLEPQGPTMIASEAGVVWHIGIPGAGAGARPGSGSPDRHLRVRRDPLRDDDRPSRVLGRVDRGDRERDPDRGAAECRIGRPCPLEWGKGGRVPGARADRPPLSREESRGAIPVGARPRVRARRSVRAVRSPGRERAPADMAAAAVASGIRVALIRGAKQAAAAQTPSGEPASCARAASRAR